MDIPYFQIAGLNTYSSPTLVDGALIHSVNCETFPYGAKRKRAGYTTFLGTPDTAQVQSLFVFPNIGDDNTKLNLFRASGSALYHSLQGTGAWTLSGNGTISNGAHFGHALLDNVLIGGDGVGSTRHTTNGTSFTDTTLAPIAEYFEMYQNRIYAAGTSSTQFYSTTNDATNWNTSGTSDSSSFQVPGAGKMGQIFKVADKLIETKSSGLMYKWDGYALIDMATEYGPSSPYSIGNVEGYNFFMNQYGHYGFNGSNPKLLSHVIERYFDNIENTGIAGTAFASIPAVVHKHDYLATIGTVTDDFTHRTINDAILKYDFHKSEYLMYTFADKPTAWCSYTDTTGARQLIFGDATGQVYQMGTATTDNGAAINMEMVFLFHGGRPDLEKTWEWYRGVFNPGCEAVVQVACSNVLEYESLIWQDVADVSSGVAELRFPAGSRSRFLFLRIYESSKNSRTTYYGCNISAELVSR